VWPEVSGLIGGMVVRKGTRFYVNLNAWISLYPAKSKAVVAKHFQLIHSYLMKEVYDYLAKHEEWKEWN
jgi:hypothetical protein